MWVLRSHRQRPPEALKWHWQNELVGALIARLRLEYGDEELRSWTWVTWTEPNCPCHFRGTYDQMADLILMTRNVLRRG